MRSCRTDESRGVSCCVYGTLAVVNSIDEVPMRNSPISEGVESPTLLGRNSPALSSPPHSPPPSSPWSSPRGSPTWGTPVLERVVHAEPIATLPEPNFGIWRGSEAAHGSESFQPISFETEGLEQDRTSIGQASIGQASIGQASSVESNADTFENRLLDAVDEYNNLCLEVIAVAMVNQTSPYPSARKGTTLVPLTEAVETAGPLQRLAVKILFLQDATGNESYDGRDALTVEQTDEILDLALKERDRLDLAERERIRLAAIAEEQSVRLTAQEQSVEYENVPNERVTSDSFRSGGSQSDSFRTESFRSDRNHQSVRITQQDLQLKDTRLTEGDTRLTEEDTRLTEEDTRLTEDEQLNPRRTLSIISGDVVRPGQSGGRAGASRAGSGATVTLPVSAPLATLMAAGKNEAVTVRANFNIDDLASAILVHFGFEVPEGLHPGQYIEQILQAGRQKTISPQTIRQKNAISLEPNFQVPNSQEPNSQEPTQLLSEKSLDAE
ncbi:hypothetical protein GNI_024800 [Gregarina niphandrodes]|uniref:Uncharacterized protein n=1 Tax=Gregarina niphandrodes TaxID=110365 RepID=A0A023BBF7_GRENI|nr:hypothetical protein GNI_024800 [Gregarina niphandrodes]EZG79657.1 hypothetical protein GNI_024800 [Gregarina niphandrodes]|eukprot:XP_011134402.1 hypothetical protein GNI_024800 [Gregarina niphandrodes]